jgi:hypothetical protein
MNKYHYFDKETSSSFILWDSQFMQGLLGKNGCVNTVYFFFSFLLKFSNIEYIQPCTL